MIRPIGKRVLVRPDEKVTSVGGIFLPETEKKKDDSGEVVEIGDIDSVKIGDKIIFAKYGSTEIKYDDNDYLLVEEKDILAKIEV